MLYSIARTDLGPVAVKLEGITPYLDGFKVALWIAVLVPVEVQGLKGELTWIENDPAVLKIDQKHFRTKEFSTPLTFTTGRYAEVEVIVAPASAAGLKQFRVALKSDQISIARPLKR